MTAERLTHAAACERWGLPDAQEGSVNDPRTHEENGVRYNEKWIYHLADGGRRIVYWHRYDFRGSVREAADGGVSVESP